MPDQIGAPSDQPEAEKPAQISEKIEKITTQTLDEIRQEELSISKKSLSIYRMLLWTNIALAASSIMLAVFTWQLSDSTKVLMDSSANQVRAYVFPDKFNITLKKNDVITNVFLKNYGESPAYDMYASIEASITLQGKDGFHTFGYGKSCSDDGNTAPLVLASNDHIIVTADDANIIGNTPEKVSLSSIDNFSDDQMRKLNSGTGVYSISGLVCYKDMLKRWHFTRFCRYYKINDIKNNDPDDQPYCNNPNDSS